MAVVGNQVLTLSDWAKRMDPGGQVDKIVEILAQDNEILLDMQWREGNLPTGHKTTMRTGLPQAAWRLLNYGVPNGKSTTAQVTDTTGMLEIYSEVDKVLARLNGDVGAFRLSEAAAFLEGMNQQMAQTLFYGNTAVNPERFLGLAPRYSTISTDPLLAASNVVDGGGAGTANTSIWLIVWNENTLSGIFPKGSKAGIDHQDLGEQTLFDAQGGKYQGYRDHFSWHAGLSLRDWRYVVRIANIDVPALSAAGTAADATKNLINLMIAAEERIPSLGGGRAAWYGNRHVRTALRRGVLEKISNNLTDETVAGRRVTSFNGIPFRKVDQILATEARVLAA